ncbi:MAG: UDP-2,3-diacylglucosamine diphosphatase [Rhodocyclaceae bacterium]|nr:UDP-2,3-diacylglucosamine diphosphatase [Rhodocyclaceae bacterium]
MHTLAVGEDERLLFIADLHLGAERPATTAALLAFLTDTAPGCQRLFILGDLFEYWIGDDDDHPVAARVATALHALSEGGTACYFMAGNRDFLLGEAYARRAGLTRLDDPTLLAGPNLKLLLMHGDTLCTDDKPYQAFRAQVRNPAWQADFLSRPLEVRRAMAEQARSHSRIATAGKAEAIMDVNADAVVAALASAGSPDLLHGHTHRPGCHPVNTAERLCRRWVLADWTDRPEYLAWDGVRMQPLSGAPAPN